MGARREPEEAWIAASHKRHDNYVETVGDGAGPMMIDVSFGGQPPMVAHRATGLNISIWDVQDGDPALGFVAMKCMGRAQFIALSPASLRALGSQLLVTADLLDGGKGKQ